MSLTAKKEHKVVTKDVLVVGGGTAGFVAAIAAARNGAKVLLLEQRDHLGGTHSGGMVMMIRSMRHMKAPQSLAEKKLMITSYESSFEEEQLVRSIAQEYIDRMIAIGSAWGQKGQAATRQMFDPEIAKWVIQKMVEEAGVEVWLNTQASDVLMDGNTIKGVVIDTLRDRVEVHAKMTIDTTGDGDVAAASGASFEFGSPDDGRCQPLSLYYAIGGVDLDKVFGYMTAHPKEFGEEYVAATVKLRAENKPFTMFPFKEKVREALSKGEYPIPYGIETIDPDAIMYVVRPMFRNGKFRYDVTYHNMDMAYNIDGTNRIELSDATLAMRDLANRMAIFYRKYVPGYEDSYLSYTAQSVGVRDTRRIVGDYTLTNEDVLEGRSFPDGIGRYGSLMDVHDKAGKKSVSLIAVGGQGWFHVPFRTLLPKGINNLMVAGRCVSADYAAQGSVRSQAASMVTGQAVGTAAALAASKGTTPRDLDYAELQGVLRSQEQII
ncbi:MAG TPA: FAD-dependent oxidoreductase [Paraburkholderia sp.]|jgi:ribulose 1,5-bisphosphate synthetase/thiazole synthase|nr:FAD-dependent oxidoreductase [Paraburkholderia sp.]